MFLKIILWPTLHPPTTPHSPPSNKPVLKIQIMLSKLTQSRQNSSECRSQDRIQEDSLLILSSLLKIINRVSWSLVPQVEWEKPGVIPQRSPCSWTQEEWRLCPYWTGPTGGTATAWWETGHLAGGQWRKAGSGPLPVRPWGPQPWSLGQWLLGIHLPREWAFWAWGWMRSGH